eukprot:4885547-Pleurochrysis_carterae.AAC.1
MAAQALDPFRALALLILSRVFRASSCMQAMTYRIGAHSTSDDDSKYRRPESPEPGYGSERAFWEARAAQPNDATKRAVAPTRRRTHARTTTRPNVDSNFSLS